MLIWGFILFKEVVWFFITIFYLIQLQQPRSEQLCYSYLSGAQSFKVVKVAFVTGLSIGTFLTQNNLKWLTDSDQKVVEHLKLPHWCDGPIWIKPQKEVVLRHPVASYVVMIITSWRIVEPTGSSLHNTFCGIYMFDSYAAVLLH